MLCGTAGLAGAGKSIKIALPEAFFGCWGILLGALLTLWMVRVLVVCAPSCMLIFNSISFSPRPMMNHSLGAVEPKMLAEVLPYTARVDIFLECRAALSGSLWL